MAPAPDILREEYRIRFSSLQDYRDGVWRVLCRDYFSALVPPQARVLDLGCGWGEFINNIVADEKYGLDLNPDSAHHVRPDVRLLAQDCSQPWPLPNESLDVVFTSNFIEHLPDKGKVEFAMSEARRCLKCGGRLICLGPNLRYVGAAYWDFWDHVVPITDVSLCELLTALGFEIQSSLPRFLPFSMSTGFTPPLILVRWYLKIPLVWPIFGRQFLVVGRKVDEGNHG